MIILSNSIMSHPSLTHLDVQENLFEAGSIHELVITHLLL
jgi:hypothetical protein